MVNYYLILRHHPEIYLLLMQMNQIILIISILPLFFFLFSPAFCFEGYRRNLSRRPAIQ